MQRLNKGDILRLTVPSGRSLPEGTHRVEVATDMAANGESCQQKVAVKLSLDNGWGAVFVLLWLPEKWYQLGGFLGEDEFPVGVILEEQNLVPLLEESIKLAEEERNG